ncbi:uncharacterized protein (TIGR00369 family) [Paraburkholderia sp. GAS348]
MNAYLTPVELVNAGWRLHTRKGFTGLVGPLWSRRDQDGGVTLGVITGDDHLNPGGFVHGGLLATLLDHVVSTLAWEAANRTPCVTIQLDTKYLTAVPSGSFVEARGSVIRQTRELVFAQGELRVGTDVAAAGTAVLKIVTHGRKQGNDD